MANPNFTPRTGGVFEPTHGFSLVNQEIQVNKKGSFYVKFPNVWQKYKLPRVTGKSVYDDWLASQMQFWQNQLNFAVWCATSGCGVSKVHLSHHDLMTRSVFRFHAYYQIRRILSEMSCPLPTENSFNPLNNGINMNAYERICNEFGISPRSNWRQKYDLSNGMGSYFFNKKFYDWKLVTIKKWSKLTNGGNYNQSMDWKVRFDADSFGGVDKQIDDILYITQLFDHDPGYTDTSIRKGDPMAVIGSFVLNERPKGFTQAGISRINDSIRVYAWAILGSQAQARSTILGTGKAYDAQKQFLSNVEDAINSEVDLPDSIDRYQRTLQYAQSKLDFVTGSGLYMLPSNMEMQVGTVNGYNNLLQIATDDMQLGVNAEVNEESVQVDFQSKVDSNQGPPPPSSPSIENELTSTPVSTDDIRQLDEPLTHDEKKLSLILGVTFIGSVVKMFSK
jgi:hypothetical protein